MLRRDAGEGNPETTLFFQTASGELSVTASHQPSTVPLLNRDGKRAGKLERESGQEQEPGCAPGPLLEREGAGAQGREQEPGCAPLLELELPLLDPIDPVPDGIHASCRLVKVKTTQASTSSFYPCICQTLSCTPF